MDPCDLELPTSHTFPPHTTDAMISNQESVRTIVTEVLSFLERDNAFIRDFLITEFEGTKELVDSGNVLTVVVCPSFSTALYGSLKSVISV